MLPKRLRLAVAVTTTMAAAGAQAALDLDANLEFDTTHYNKVSDSKRNARDSSTDMSGRVEANFGARGNSGDAFVAVRASLLVKKDGDAAVDDMWVQFGNARGDLKLGRFEAMDLFPLGKDTVVESALANGYAAYQANALRGRFGSGYVHAALGANLGQGLRAELGVVHGNEDGEVKGVRPALQYSLGALTLRGGVESIRTVGVSGSDTGYGLSLGYAVSDDVKVNLNFAKREDDRSVGANVTYGPAGLGVIHGRGKHSDERITTVYAAYSFPLLDVPGATITPALSLAKGDSDTATQAAFRIRINYAF